MENIETYLILRNKETGSLVVGQKIFAGPFGQLNFLIDRKTYPASQFFIVDTIYIEDDNDIKSLIRIQERLEEWKEKFRVWQKK